MTRQTGFSTRLAACGAMVALAAFGCTTTSDETDTTDTGSEFQQADQDDVEVAVEEVEETTVVDEVTLDLQTVYFDFDQASIRPDARPVLRSNGDQMRSTNVAVRLEGHCDERGSEEYNLALGERRAMSVKQYLENLGVDARYMRTISYGEAKPAVAGHTEAAWRYNRRVNFVPMQ
jgi:peptidoglycan-associated lipoprotein